MVTQFCFPRLAIGNIVRNGERLKDLRIRVAVKTLEGIIGRGD